MVQKIGAQYITKKIAAQLTTPAADAEAPADAPSRPPAQAPRRNVEMFQDENGNVLGPLHELTAVTVYVVGDADGDVERELMRCVLDKKSRVFFRSEEGNLSAIIYVPDPARRGGKATRADDI